MSLRNFFVFLTSIFMGFAVLSSEPASENFVKSNIDNIFTILRSNKSKQSQIHSIGEIISKSCNMKYAAKFSLGANWRNISPEQREQFFDVYKGYVTNRYADIFFQNKESIYALVPSKDDLVSFEFASKNAKKPISLKFKTEQQNGSFIINDILVEDLSVLQMQRDEFNSIIAEKGFNGLMEHIKKLSQVK